MMIMIHENGYKIICISNHQIKSLCPGIYLVPSLVLYDKMLQSVSIYVVTSSLLNVG